LHSQGAILKTGEGKKSKRYTWEGEKMTKHYEITIDGIIRIVEAQKRESVDRTSFTLYHLVGSEADAVGWSGAVVVEDHILQSVVMELGKKNIKIDSIKPWEA